MASSSNPTFPTTASSSSNPSSSLLDDDESLSFDDDEESSRSISNDDEESSLDCCDSIHENNDDDTSIIRMAQQQPKSTTTTTTTTRLIHRSSDEHDAQRSSILALSNNTTSTSRSLLLEKERQLLLLMLLAQVCALHDPSPKTFTVHVLELFEKGILDQDCLVFLWELGILLPPMTTTHNSSNTRSLLLRTSSSEHQEQRRREEKPQQLSEILEANDNGSASAEVSSKHHSIRTEDNALVAAATEASIPKRTIDPSNAAETASMMTTTATTTTTTTTHQQREAVAIAIRSHLERTTTTATPPTTTTTRPQQQQNQQQEQQCATAQIEQGRLPYTSSSQPSHSNNNDNSNNSWTVQHHPLSLSRYQREFEQVRLLNSGAFGYVYEVKSKLDGMPYAIKRVVFTVQGFDYTRIATAIREVSCLASCHDHEHCVRYYTSWLEPSWMTGSTSTTRNGRHHYIDDDDDYYDNNDGNNDDGHDYDSITSTNTMPQHLLASAALTGSSSGNTHHGVVERTVPSIRKASSFSFGTTTARRHDIDNNDDSDDDVHVLGSNNKEYDDWLYKSSSRNNVAHEMKSKDDSYCIMDETSSSATMTRESTMTTPSSLPHYRYEVHLFIQMQLCSSSTLSDWITQRNARHVHVHDSVGGTVDCHHQTKQQQRQQQCLAEASSSSSSSSSFLSDAMNVFTQILKGLAHVHSKGIVHRDLKPANVFIDQHGKFLLGDFGLSRLLSHKSTRRCSHGSTAAAAAHEQSDDVVTTLTTGIGTASYAAPEQVTSETYGTEVDIFSLGLILLELVCVFGTQHERMEAFTQCRSFQTLPTWLTTDHPNVADMILQCTHPIPCQRPTAADLLSSSSPGVAASHVGGVTTEHHALRLKLQEKEHELKRQRSEIDEKDRIIQDLQSQVKRLSMEKQGRGGNDDDDVNSNELRD